MKTGERLFRDEDIPKLSALPAVGLQKIFDAGRKLSGMDAEDVEGKRKN
jgi:hypothetical protein